MNPYITLTSIDPEFEEKIKTALSGYQLEISEKTVEHAEIDEATAVLGVFVDSLITKKLIDELPHLKHITTFSTGFDHIDLKAAKKRKITVSNVPRYGENTVAEHALALILSLSRKLYPSIKRVKEGIYDYHNLTGFDLKGKTVGIIGTGRIGMHLVDMLKGLGMRIFAYDAYPNKTLEITYTSLEKLLAESDIISLHVPLLPNTRHIIDMKAVKRMKKGSYIVNTARGGLIDAEALLFGLQSGIIAGAGLDVLEEELIFKSPEMILGLKSQDAIRRSLIENAIIDHPHTIITPHNAFNSTEALNRIIDTATGNITSFIEGKSVNLVKL